MVKLTKFLFAFMFRLFLMVCVVNALTYLYIGLGIDSFVYSLFGSFFSSTFIALLGVWDFSVPEPPESSVPEKPVNHRPEDLFNHYPYRLLQDLYGKAPSVLDRYDTVDPTTGRVNRIVMPGMENYLLFNSIVYYLKCLGLTAAVVIYLIILYKGRPEDPRRVAEVLFHIEELLQAFQVHGPGYEEFIQAHANNPAVAQWPQINAMRLHLPNARPVALTVLETFRDFLWEHAPPEFFQEIEQNRLEDLERWQPPQPE